MIENKSADPVIKALAEAERSAYIELKNAEARHASAKKALCEEIASRGVSSVEWNGQVITRVFSERVKINQAAFKNAVSSEAWDKCVTEKIDPDKVKKMIVNGELNWDAIDGAVEIVESAPYVRYSQVSD